MHQVVRSYKNGHVCFVALEEREFKNTFTTRLIDGLQDVFSLIQADADIKAVVVHGYGNYFCCGGTKEELVDLYHGFKNKADDSRVIQFADLQLHDLFLRCKVPVIAAMQGHAIGGGLAMGCFADLMVMGKQCIYSANFMKYGFTPGMGATYILPERFGATLAAEMLLTARSYYGSELQKCGVPITIVDKDEVIEVAASVAQDLVEKPRQSLIMLKEHLTRKIRAELPAAVEGELDMHRISFAQPEVLTRIDQFFGN